MCQTAKAAATRTTMAKPKWQRHWPTWRMSNSTLTPQRRAAWFCLQPHTHTVSHSFQDSVTHTHTTVPHLSLLLVYVSCFALLSLQVKTQKYLFQMSPVYNWGLRKLVNRMLFRPNPKRPRPQNAHGRYPVMGVSVVRKLLFNFSLGYF